MLDALPGVLVKGALDSLILLLAFIHLHINRLYPRQQILIGLVRFAELPTVLRLLLPQTRDHGVLPHYLFVEFVGVRCGVLKGRQSVLLL